MHGYIFCSDMKYTKIKRKNYVLGMSCLQYSTNSLELVCYPVTSTLCVLHKFPSLNTLQKNSKREESDERGT